MSKINNNFKYPCTRLIPINGFGEFLEKEIKEPRRNIRLFAREFAELIADNKEIPTNHIIMTNSGSSSNLVATLAIAEKLKREGKPLTAITSAFTFPTTMSSLLLAGFNVKFIDVDKYGFNLSLDKLERLDEKPSLVVVTHFLGFPCDMGRLQKYKEKTGCHSTLSLKDMEFIGDTLLTI